MHRRNHLDIEKFIAVIYQPWEVERSNYLSPMFGCGPVEAARGRARVDLQALARACTTCGGPRFRATVLRT
jgi:hypothetical protein